MNAKPVVVVSSKQSSSRSDHGFLRIRTVCHPVCEFAAKTVLRKSDWMTVTSGSVKLIYSAGQGLSYGISISLRPTMFVFAVLCTLQHVTSSVEVGSKTVKRYILPVKDYVEFVMQNVSIHLLQMVR